MNVIGFPLNFAAQAPGILQHATAYMQEAFFVQNLIPGSREANLTALSLAALTSHRNAILVSHHFEGKDRSANAMQIWGNLFDRFNDIPSMRDRTLKSCATENPADAILIGALQAAHPDRWKNSEKRSWPRTFIGIFPRRREAARCLPSWVSDHSPPLLRPAMDFDGGGFSGTSPPLTRAREL